MPISVFITYFKIGIGRPSSRRAHACSSLFSGAALGGFPWNA
jgi:hypothetical protein